MIKWKAQPQKYANGKDGFVNKYIFFQIVWDGCTAKDDPNKYKLKCFLPGIKANLGNYKSEEEAIAKAKSVLKMWLINTNLFFM